MTLSVEIILAIATVIFSAGGAYYGIARIRKDCNGLGAKTGRLQDDAQRRYLRLVLVIMQLEPDPSKRAALAEFLKE